MSESTPIRAALVTALLASLTLITATPRVRFAAQDGPRPTIFRHSEEPISDPRVISGLNPASPDSLSSTSTYYSLRPDRRRCASPLCGGYFVKRVNDYRTRCADGRYMAECYVAAIDWNGQSQVDANKALLRGNVVSKRFGRSGKLGALSVTESWQAASDNSPTGTFYRVKDRGLRCIAAPCLTHHEAKLNSTADRNIAGVDLKGAGASDELVAKAAEEMTGPYALLVAGSHAQVTGPAGRAIELRATQFYVRAKSPIANKPCIQTGCSKQVCADKEVITTCEWRSEYACYQKARCERQANGACGFTKTPELTACLRGK